MSKRAEFEAALDAALRNAREVSEASMSGAPITDELLDDLMADLDRRHAQTKAEAMARFDQLARSSAHG